MSTNFVAAFAGVMKSKPTRSFLISFLIGSSFWNNNLLETPKALPQLRTRYAQNQ
jgi:hypothetical protein